MTQSNEQTGAADDTFSSRRAWLWLSAALLVAGVLFGQAFDYGIIPTWDDGVFVVDRPEIQDWWGVSWTQRLLTPKIGYPLPVPTFIYAHAHLFFGEHAFRALHALSTVLHLINAVLVFLLVHRWFDRRLGVVVAGLWAVHPVTVETVVWLTNLKTVLAATFLLGAMVLWQRRVIGAPQRPRWPVYLGTTLLFIAGLGCRPDAAILPVVLAVQCLTAPKPRPALIRHAGFLLTALLGAGAFVVFADTAHSGIVERSVFYEDGFSAILARIFHALELSTKHLLFPVDLHPGYFQNWTEGVLEALPGIAILVAILGAIGALLAAGRRKIASVCILAAVFYAPYSNILFLPRFTADTYLYLVSFAGLTALVLLLRLFASRATDEADRRALVHRGLALLAVLTFGGFAWLTFGQVQRWQNAITLWKPVMEEQPRVPRPYFHIAYAYTQRQDWQAARQVLADGYPVLRASRDIPSFMPTVLLNTGEPRRAAEVALQALMGNRDVEPHLHKVYLETLVAHKTPLADAPEVIEQTRESVDVYLDQPEWMAQQNVGTGFGAYFLNQDHPELAAPFVQHALDQDEPHCSAWELNLKLPSRFRMKEFVPLPSHCE